MKKLLSVLIAMVMLVGVLSVTASADSKTVDVYGCSISAAAKQICFVAGDEDNSLTKYVVEGYAPGFKKYYYIPTGTVIDCKVIAEKLPELQNLAIVYGEVKNLSALGNLKDLVWLGLYQNEGAEDLSFLKKLPQLKKFRYKNVYGDKPCESVKPVSYLKELTELYLDVQGSIISDISPLKGLTKLKKLEIDSVIRENISLIGNMKNLRELDIQIDGDADVSFLGQLTKLESLELRSSGDGIVKGLDSIKGLKKLKRLDLVGFYNYYGKQQDLSFIGEMTGLENLDLSYSNKTFTKTVGNLKGLKELTLIDVNNCNPYDMSFLKDLTGLEDLFIMGVHDLDDTGISKLKKLKSLTIMLCEFDDLSQLKKCSSLEELNVYNCNTDFDVKWITGTNIKKVFFSAGGNGRIENMDKLGSLKKLEEIILDFTGIPEDTIMKIKKALPNCKIEVCELIGGDYDERTY
ncbi:MAG: hypothetical protein J1F11_08965 [Oscillospiraceae bacterium]|nr:hypothetical protein [Oscillospiraceae bacterium]